MKIERKLRYTFFAFSFIPLVLLIFVGYQFHRATVIESVSREMEGMASAQAAAIRAVLHRDRIMLSVVSKSKELREIMHRGAPQATAKTQRQLDDYLSEIFEILPSVRQAVVFSAKGQLLAEHGTQLAQTQGKIDRMFSYGTTKLTFVDIFKHPTDGKFLSFAAPIRDKQELLGVLGLVFEADAIFEVTSDRTGLGRTGEILLVKRTQTGDVVFITPPSQSSNAALTTVVPKERQDIPAVLALNRVEGLFVNDVVSHENHALIAATRYIELADWGLVTNITLDEVLEPVTMLRNFLLISGAMLLLCCMLVVRRTAKTLTNPIASVTAVARLVSLGNYRHRIQVSSNDEIGELANSVNAMAENFLEASATLDAKVKERTSDLELSRQAALNIMQDTELARRDLEQAQYQLERALRKAQDSEKRFQTVLEATPSGLVMVGPDGIIELVNTEAEKLFDYTREEMLGQPITMLLPERYHSKSSARNPLVEDILSKESGGRDLHAQRKDGSEFPVEIGLNPVQGGNGTSVLSAIVDVTERKRTEMEIFEYSKQLKQRNSELARSNRELDNFAYIASHDLKEPLRGIFTYAWRLERKCSNLLDDEAVSNIQSIQRLAKRMETLIETLMRYSRVGKMDIEFETVDLNRVILEVAEVAHLSFRDVPLEIRIESPLPSVRGNQALLTEVFQNLVMNALKYNDSEKRVAEIGIAFHDAAGNELSDPTDTSITICVRDNGIGIKKKHEKSVFRLFKRLNHHSKYGDGTGAGLTITDKIVRRLGGRIWFDSEYGQGTTFYVTLEQAQNESHQFEPEHLDA